ncbi:hypothetical protein [Bosea sp. FBZP-16]|uniref:hypothetical protein n=1 Tax=Bosea sp. FBZP-16 TaxID=2065382 RepID=UPI000C31601C|nr:hypothetical protein [Bosea sp. FBZP-16]
MASAFVVFASRYNVAVEDAYVLPALFERTAQKVGMSASALLSRATFDCALGEYLADCARKVAASDKAAL